MFRIFITIILSLFVSVSIADRLPTKVNQSQLDNIQFACEFGRSSTVVEFDLCYILAAISWRESRAGEDIGRHKKNHYDFGLFQNNIATVTRRLAQEKTHIPRNELKEMLFDREVSAYFAEFELSEWYKVRKGDLHKTLNSYNAGYDYKKAGGYADHVLQIAKYLEDNRTKFGI